VRIGIDDFGTGHSSFAYLHEFPADVLKIDQSFVRGMEARQDKADIVGTVAALAEQLGLHVIAEGIESEAQLGLIQSRRCEYVQGYLFSRPVDPEAAADLLRNGVPQPVGSPSGEEALPPDSQARPRLPESPKRRGKISRPAYLCAGLAAVALLCLVALPARFARWPAAPPQTNAAGAGSKAAAGVEPPAPEVRPRPPQTTSATFAVVHQHLLGNCRGMLQVSSSGVSYASDNEKDSFSLKYSKFQAALDGNTLNIKSDQKTYKFKAADVTDNDANLSRLRRAVSAINASRPK
jgi:hypothetical protein